MGSGQDPALKRWENLRIEKIGAFCVYKYSVSNMAQYGTGEKINERNKTDKNDPL